MPLLIIGALFVVWVVMRLSASASEARNEESDRYDPPYPSFGSQESVDRQMLAHYLGGAEPDENGERIYDLDAFLASQGQPPDDAEGIHRYLKALVAHLDRQAAESQRNL